jgi:hypothetical protein
MDPTDMIIGLVNFMETGMHSILVIFTLSSLEIPLCPQIRVTGAGLSQRRIVSAGGGKNKTRQERRTEKSSRTFQNHVMGTTR